LIVSTALLIVAALIPPVDSPPSDLLAKANKLATVVSYFFRYNFFPILQRKNQMIQQQSFIVTFINVFTHSTKLWKSQPLISVPSGRHIGNKKALS
jgi:hypothetical protein